MANDPRAEIAIVGSGPAALMAAEILSNSDCSITVFEKRKSAGRKLLIAGSSGLNITNALPTEEFAPYYTPKKSSAQVMKAVRAFPPQKWISWIESLGLPTFKGTSGRYFIEEMKASKLLKAWTERLTAKGVRWKFGAELSDFEVLEGTSGIRLAFSDGSQGYFKAVCLALGGGSYEPDENPLRWTELIKKKKILFHPFVSSNAGFEVSWSRAFLKEAVRLPLKNVTLSSPKGAREGDCMITEYGIEGTPVYFVGQTGLNHLDLKPDLTHQQMTVKCNLVRENLSPMRRVKKSLNLCPAALALLFHETPENAAGDLGTLLTRIKKFPVILREPRPLSEAISSSGGISLDELDDRGMLKKYPGIFVAGEMLDWDAPTGGFLIQACVSQGFVMGQEALKYR